MNSKVKVAIRADASVSMGSGHIMRCITLGAELQSKKIDVMFICRNQAGHLGDEILRNGFELHMLPAHFDDKDNRQRESGNQWLNVSTNTDANETIEVVDNNNITWMIVDHYGIGASWHSMLRNHVGRIMVIDDLADREFDCDLLLNQTFNINEKIYKNYVADDCRMLLGSKYALLRNDFSKLRADAIKRRKGQLFVKRILVSMGGVDKDNITGYVLNEIENIKWVGNPGIDVVIGTNSPNKEMLDRQIKNHKLPINLHVGISNMAELMLESDVAIGASGTTTWERCCLGLPTILLVIAKNQKAIANNVSNYGAAILGGEVYSKSASTNLTGILEELVNSPELLKSVSDKAFDVCDGLGAQRVTKVLLN